ncbi:hypothetical protein VNI00_014157 [Paramarasmius palmivorus]|uniref:Fungal-type protein kinase domain-containing protein n=1 Tax=Paramarasmius palmivorus TaxID=297713 RepID=A0AAW0BUL9_9AGAR
MKHSTGHSQISNKLPKNWRPPNAELESGAFYVGPVEPSDFLQKYLPNETDDMPSFNKERKQAFEYVVNCTSSTPIEETRKLMVDAIRPFSPNLKVNIANSSCKFTAQHATETHPSISLSTEYTIPAYINVAFSGDPELFNDSLDSASFLGASEESQLKRKEMAFWAGTQMVSEHRTHAFSVLVTRDSARLLRWDRAGVVVTRKFDYTKEPWLVDFVWSFNHAFLENQGWDLSFTPADESDTANIKRTKAVLGLLSHVKVYKVEVLDGKTGMTHYYYGADPVKTPSASSPDGRCTKGFVLVDEEGKKVFLKNTWRILRPDDLKESDVYEMLKGVEHIPTVIAAGDVKGEWQQTDTHTWCDDEVATEITVYCHHLLLFEEVGTPLYKFKNTRELVTAMRDAVQAHTDACKRGILHRDVSIGNILIGPDGGGLLIDWELAKSTMPKGTQIMERTGTWQFMSVHLLSNAPGTVEHTLLDDLESFFHVLSYIVLIRCEHGVAELQLQRHLHKVYDAWFVDDEIDDEEVVVDGQGKELYMTTHFMADDARLPISPLRDLVVALEEVLAARYKRQPTQVQMTAYEKMVWTISAKEHCPLEFLEVLAHPVWVYDENMKKLDQASRWMLEVFNRALQNPRGLTAKPVVRPSITTPYIRAMSEHPSRTLKRKRDKKDPQEGTESKKPKEAPSGSGSKRLHREAFRIEEVAFGT